jgi:tellurite resistance protein TerC
MSTQSMLWIWFFILITFMLILDLGFFNKKAHEIEIKEAIKWTLIWIWLAMVFDLVIYFCLWSEKSMEFLTWYVVEKSLSVDNLFVFLLVFSYFKVEKKYQHKVLFWWILWAIIMRAIFIFLWIEIIQIFHFIIYIFGAFLLFTWIKMLFNRKEEINFEEKWIVKFIKKKFRLLKNHDSWNFIVKIDWQRYATPLLLTLVTLEISDLIFAVDSIPAILGISSDMFIVYSSNIFAILWLRSLYFVLASMIWKFEYLKYWLSWILSFIWIKMLISWYYEVPTLISLLVIILFLVLYILASFILKKE